MTQIMLSTKFVSHHPSQTLLLAKPHVRSWDKSPFICPRVSSPRFDSWVYNL